MQHKCIKEITFGLAGNAESFQASGWSDPEETFTWSIGNHAELRLPRINAQGKAVLIIRLSPFLNLPRLASQRLSIDVDGVPVFVGRCWGDQRLALRFDFEDRDDAFVIISASFPDAAQPSEFGIDDSRALAFMWRSIQIYALEDDGSAESPSRQEHSRSLDQSSLEETIGRWVEEELQPWRLHPPRRLATEFIFAHLNATTHWAAIYRFHRGQVDFIPKPDHIVLDPIVFDRAQLYLSFLRSLTTKLAPDFETTLCICVADYPMRIEEAPILAFQKSNGMETILLPDIDFLIHDFYGASDYLDQKTYFEKKTAAVFAGSTTGGDIDTETATSGGLPRLRAAEYFAENGHVDFYLPNVVQCISTEAEEVLRSKSFCQKPALSWRQQCAYRFLISIDGNGATCSRVALSLSSNSVLLKYRSFDSLYYFHGLVPWVHFVPLFQDSDVDVVINEELASPGRFSAIAQDGREFAARFLTRESVESYMAVLLTRYANLFED